jgi:transposase
VAPDESYPEWDDLLAQLAGAAHEEGWVGLAEAAGAAGVALSTLRSWYRSGALPSRMVPGPHGPQRLVPLEAVLARALSSALVRRQLENARSVETELVDLRRRVAALERLLGLG